MPKKVYWPSYRYHPTECPEGKVFKRPEDVPVGWVSHLKDFVEPKAEAPEAPANAPGKEPTAKELKAAAKAAAIAAEAAEKERQELLAKARERFGAVPDDATIDQLKAALQPAA